MRGRFSLYFLGVACLGLGLLLLAFFLYASALAEPFYGFALAALISSALGAVLLLSGEPGADPSRREAIVGVLVLWLLIPLLGAIPFWLDGGMSFLNAFFESMSGFTTTGATVLNDFGSFPASLFLWRAFSQWLGGVGIIVLFIAVLPQLAIAGRQMFLTEAPGPTTDLLAPKLRDTARAVSVVYSIITLLAILSYALAGMPLYDAVANGLTTPASGGFSPNGLSIAGYNLPTVEWLCALFMLLAGSNFALQYRVLLGQPRMLLRDPEFRTYLGIILVASVALSLTLLQIYVPRDAIRHAFFQVLAILTTTGYASADFALWPQSSQALLVLLMFIGGSAGSAAGGIKVVRWLIIVNQARAEMQRALHPRAVRIVRVGPRARGCCRQTSSRRWLPSSRCSWPSPP